MSLEDQSTCVSYLRAVFDVMALVEAQVAQVVGWGSFVGFPRLWRKGKVWEMVRKGVESIHDVVQRSIGRYILINVVVYGLQNRNRQDSDSTQCFYTMCRLCFPSTDFHFIFNGSIFCCEKNMWGLQDHFSYLIQNIWRWAQLCLWTGKVLSMSTEKDRALQRMTHCKQDERHAPYGQP